MTSRPLEILGRVAFWSLIPTIVLAVAAQVAAAHASDVVAALGVSTQVVGTFNFILLGSMLINTLLILRTPATLRSRSLDPLTAIPVLALAALMVATDVLLATGMFEVVFVALPIPAIVLSIVICIGAVRRRKGDTGGARTSVPVRPSVRIAIISAAVVALTLVVASPILDLRTEVYELIGNIGTPWQWGLFLFGLPWSYLAQLVTAVIVVPATTSSYMLFTYGSVTSTTIVLAATAVLNIAIALVLLVNERLRVRAFNRFFRLGRRNTDSAE